MPSIVQTLKTIQRRAWEVREFGGQERTYFAIATATGDPIDPTVRSEMAALHKRAVFALDALAVEREYAGLSEGIARDTDIVREFYTSRYGDVRRAILDASDVGTDYPIDFQGFFTLSSEALGLAVSLSHDAGAAIRTELQAVTEAAGRELAAYSGLLVLAMALCGFQIFYTRYSVARRMDGIIDLMDRLTGGDTSIDVDRYRSRDEIGRMAAAVDVFRQGLIEKEELEAETRRKDEKALEERRAALQQVANRIESETREAIQEVRAQSESLIAEIETLVGSSRHVRTESETVAGSTREATDTLLSVSESTQNLTESIGHLRETVRRPDGHYERRHGYCRGHAANGRVA